MSLVTESSYYGRLPWQSQPSDDPYFCARDEHAWRLHAEGMSGPEIARRLGVSKSNPRMMAHRHNVRMELYS